jgi:hypothetical protein
MKGSSPHADSQHVGPTRPVSPPPGMAPLQHGDPHALHAWATKRILVRSMRLLRGAGAPDKATRLGGQSIICMRDVSLGVPWRSLLLVVFQCTVVIACLAASRVFQHAH